jgi:hypothetical protein
MRFIATGCVLLASSFVTITTVQGQYGPRGGIYDKPYLRGESPVKVGGYVDMEFSYTAQADDAASDQNKFDQRRLIPFLFAEITSNMHFSTEIEYEHGGNVEEGGEIKVEYMIIDYRFRDAFQFRSGILLSPLGKFNLIHDSPVNDLTERPLVDQQIIPTTLSEAGAGFFGTIYPSPMSVVNYEAYLVNGFDSSLIRDDSTVRVRSGRGRAGEDNNPNKAFVARVNWSPTLGLDLGLSTHLGKYHDTAQDMLTIFAVDVDYRRGPFEFLGELAQAETEREHLGLEKQTQRGYYGQANIHFLQDRLMPGSTFTGVVRYDWVDLGVKGTPDNRVSRLTFGLNFRPVEKALFKTDFQTNWTKAPGAETERDNYRFFASVATYF